LLDFLRVYNIHKLPPKGRCLLPRYRFTPTVPGLQTRTLPNRGVVLAASGSCKLTVLSRMVDSALADAAGTRAPYNI
jgi:hypothetical protein